MTAIFTMMIPLIILVFVIVFWHGWSEFAEMQSQVLRLQETVHSQTLEMHNLKEELSESHRSRDRQIEELTQMINVRDAEISRLTKMYNDLKAEVERKRQGF
jgi:cell division protein FtsL